MDGKGSPVASRQSPVDNGLAPARGLRSALGPQSLVLLLFGLGLLIRLLVWGENRGYEPFGDEQYYYRAAVILAQTGQYADPPTPAWLPVQRVPLLSVLAGGLFRLTGIDLGPVNLVQIGVSLATAWLVWRWATTLWGASAGRWALAIALFYPTLITHPASFFYTETLYAFLAAVALYWLGQLAPPGADLAVGRWPALTRRTAGLAALAGVAAGLAALTRSAGLTLLGVALLWLLGGGWRTPRRLAPLALLLVLGFALTIAPWTARNWRTYGGFLLLDTIGAYNLWRDNALPGENPASVLVRLPNPIEQQRVATERGLDNLRRYPERFLARLPSSVLYLWHLELDSYARGGGYFEDLTNRTDSFPWVLAADGAHLAVSGLALVGLALAPWGTLTPGRRRLLLLLLLWVLANLAAGVAFHSESRFRIAYQPQLIVMAVLPLVAGRGLLARARASAWRAALSLVLLALLLAGAWSPRLVPVLHMQAWVTAGDLIERWNAAAALGAYERAVAAFPASDRPLIILGDARRRAGDLAGASAAYTAALTIQPHNVNAVVPLVFLALQAGQPEEARRLLRASGTSDTDLLTWAWRAYEPPPLAALDLGSGFEVGYLRNVYPPERNEQADFRWTNGAGLIRLTVPATGATRLTLRLNGTRLGGAPAQRVTVLANGRALDTFATDGQWQTRALDLTPLRLAPGAALLVEVRSDTFVPSAVLPGTRDGRLLGVALDKVSVDE